MQGHAQIESQGYTPGTTGDYCLVIQIGQDEAEESYFPPLRFKNSKPGIKTDCSCYSRDRNGISKEQEVEDFMKLCGELMNTDIICCGENARIDKVAKIMRFTNESYIPIVSDTRKKFVVGHITERDLIEKVLSEGRHPVYTFVKDVMDGELITCGTNAPVDFVLSLMSNHGITDIPVVDDSGSLQGVISLADIADYYQYDSGLELESQSA